MYANTLYSDGFTFVGHVQEKYEFPLIIELKDRQRNNFQKQKNNTLVVLSKNYHCYISPVNITNGNQV